MKRNILKFLFSLIVIISGVSISLIHANEEDLITPERAYDYSYNYLDDGVGKFIGKTTDVENQEIDCSLRGENLYIFQYLRKDTKFPIHGEYVVVNINSIPDYVDYDSEDYYAVKDTYWYFCNYMEEKRTIETLVYFEKSDYDIDGGSSIGWWFYCYLDFGNFEIDEIYEIRLIYDLYYKGTWTWLTGNYKSNHFDVIYTATDREDLASLPSSSVNVQSLTTNMSENKNIYHLAEPLEINNNSYEYRIFLGNYVGDEYYFGDDEQDSNFSIAYMYYYVGGFLTYTDDFKIADTSYSDGSTTGDNKGLIELIKDELNKFNCNNFNYFIIIILIICLIIFIIYKNRKKFSTNKDNKKE